MFVFFYVLGAAWFWYVDGM